MAKSELRLPNEENDTDSELFAQVTTMLGANRVRVRGMDGTERTARIPGRMQKSTWIREEDLVIIDPWDFQDSKADIVHRYTKQDADTLREHLSGFEDD